jgi:hypothetical protein
LLFSAVSTVSPQRLRVTAAVAARAKTEASDHQQQIRDLQQRIHAAETERTREIKAHDAAVAADEGILARLEALHRLENDSQTMLTAHRILIVFLTAIECMPILFKTALLLMPATTYEQLFQLEDERTIDQAELDIDMRRWEQEHKARLRLGLLEARAHTQIQAESATATAVFNAQISLVKQTLKSWRKAESRRIEEHVAEGAIGEIRVNPPTPISVPPRHPKGA